MRLQRRFSLLIILVAVGLSVWLRFLAPAGTDSKTKVVSFSDDTAKVLVSAKLRQEGLIKSELAANLILTKDKYPAGGYEVSPSENIFQVSQTMLDGPQLLWVTVPPGWRKEQVAEKLVPKFRWTDKDKNDFLSFPEGEYFPDTYLVPKGSSGQGLGSRMHNNFSEKFAPYASKFLAANIKNDTALKIASLVQRESGGDDMPIITGIIWNRLEKGMGLKIDATVQYAKGEVNGNWWSRVSVDDYSSVDSPYNTYEFRGLPPTPIASTGVAAWEAVLNLAQTDCLYYLHDHLGQIHCSLTYEGHLGNVEKYLR